MLYSGSYFADQQAFTDYIQDSYVTFDANISIGAPDDKWKLSLIATNLTDETFVVTSGGVRSCRRAARAASASRGATTSWCR